MSDGGATATPAPARIEALRVQNYRVLRDLRLRDITPLTVLLGPNGSGKSTLFDVFAFLSECFTVGLRRAWDKRNRFRELRSREAEGPIVIELKYRERKGLTPITYHLAIDERPSGPVVVEEWLQWTRGTRGKPFKFLDFRDGSGSVISGDLPEIDDQRVPETLESPELLAVNTLGQFARHPRVSALRRFISGWYLSYLAADSTRGAPESGPQERLSQSGDNLPNVVQYLAEQHPERLAQILGVLHDPEPAPLVGIEMVESHLYPRLLPALATECRRAIARSQILVTTHSPAFVNELRAAELWVLRRADDGYARARRAGDMPKVTAFLEEGAQLGDLWMEGHFEVGDPLVAAGGAEGRK